jgi:uncharacterized protein YggE
MKILNILTVVLLSHSLMAQVQDAKVNQFSVVGRVELKEKADQASLSFSIKGVGPTLRQAVESANKKTKDLTDRLRAFGIGDSNISTSQFYSSENVGDKAFLSSSRDFQATISTLVKVDSLRLLQPIIFAISEAEIESLSRISFSLKDDVGFRRRARIEAAFKAKEKADDIGKALGVTLGKVVAVEEILSQPGGYPIPFNTVSFRGGRVSEGVLQVSDESGFFAQTISVTSELRVTFEIK